MFEIRGENWFGERIPNIVEERLLLSRLDGVETAHGKSDNAVRGGVVYE